MNLDIFKNDNPHMDDRRPQARTISANRKGGFFTLNSKAISELGLIPGIRVIIAKDKDSRNDWYLTFTEPDDEMGTKLRAGRRKTQQIYAMRTQNKAAVNSILNSAKALYSATFILAATPTKMPDGTTWYRILTANPIRTK